MQFLPLSISQGKCIAKAIFAWFFGCYVGISVIEWERYRVTKRHIPEVNIKIQENYYEKKRLSFQLEKNQ